jgi:hypothetical protein
MEICICVIIWLMKNVAKYKSKYVAVFGNFLYGYESYFIYKIN